MRSSLERQVPDTVLPVARHRCNISSNCIARAQWNGHGPLKLVTRLSVMQRV